MCRKAFFERLWKSLLFTHYNAMAVECHMEKTIIVCDGPGCKKKTEDFYRAAGWIHSFAASVSSISVRVSRGRKADGTGKDTGFANPKELHFCCIACMVTYFENLVKAAEEREKNATTTNWPMGSTTVTTPGFGISSSSVQSRSDAQISYTQTCQHASIPAGIDALEKEDPTKPDISFDE
jgi:hypothetical protein